MECWQVSLNLAPTNSYPYANTSVRDQTGLLVRRFNRRVVKLIRDPKTRISAKCVEN